MSWGITKVGAPPSAVAEAFRQRVEKEKAHASDVTKSVLEAHVTAVQAFVGGITSPDNPEWPRSLIVESTGHVDSSGGSFRLEARVISG